MRLDQKRLRVLLVGDGGQYPDEGMQNISRHMYACMHKDERVSVRLMTAQAILRSIRDVRRWQPDIIHCLHGPSTKGVLLAWVLKKTFKTSRLFMSLTHPGLGRLGWTLLRWCAADQLLSPTPELATFCAQIGMSTKVMPLSGVNPDRFRPVSPTRRAEVRAELGFDEASRVLLHVGHLKRKRNLQVMARLAQIRGVRAVIIGSTATNVEEDFITELRDSGCTVLHGYVPDIERYYQASDLYVFPVYDLQEAVMVPLSVLEAMASNLAVLSTTFGGLPDMFPSCAGLTYAEPDDFGHFVTTFESRTVDLRDMVLPYGWNAISDRLVSLYYLDREGTLSKREVSASESVSSQPSIQV